MRRIFTVFLMFSCLPLWCLDLPVSQIPDDSLLRIRLKDSWLTETPARVLALRPSIQTLESGERVQVSVQEGRSEFMVILARERMGGNVATDNNPATERFGTGQFPDLSQSSFMSQGSWTLTRRKDTGAGTLITIFLRSDQYTYIQFRPYTPDKCQMDAIIYGGHIVRSLPLAVPFERLYTMQLNDILKLAGDKLPIRYFEVDPVYYRDNRKFVANVRANIGGLRYGEDGAIDENGNYVFIETLQEQNPALQVLNCSGFAKWLIDGILRPVTGERLSIPPLKAPFGGRGSSLTENWESLDPFFGLDWIRNLAAEANGVLRSDVYRALDEFEVRNDSFSTVQVSQNRNFVTNNYPGFLDEAGYGFEGLYPLLYTLAVDEPFKFYLAAVNTETGEPVTQTNRRGTPRLRRYYHVAALVPYFDEYGVFRIVVFESATESSFASFRNRYPGQYVNLVKIPVVTAFEP